MSLRLRFGSQVAPVTVTGGAADGRVSRRVFATVRGYCNPHLTLEDVRDRWSEIEGGICADGALRDVPVIAGLQGDLIRKALG